jgi:excisionase family DNA binding protein
MQLSKKITPELIAGAVALIRPACAELTPSSLIAAITSYNAEKKSDRIKPPLTYAQFAILAGLSIPTVHRMAKRGDIPKIKIGLRSVRIPYASVEALLNGTVGEVDHAAK